MAKFDRKEFVLRYDLTSGNLSNYIKRGKVVLEADGVTIDSDNPVNKLWINSRLGKGNAKQSLNSGKKGRPTKEPARKDYTIKAPKGDFAKFIDAEVEKIPVLDLDDPEQIANDIFKYEVLLKQQKALNAEKDGVLKQHEIDKRTGRVIPSAPIIPVIKQHNMFILTTMKVAFESVLTEMGHKYEISSEDVAMLRASIVDRCNIAMRDATEMTKEALKDIIDSFITVKKQ